AKAKLHTAKIKISTADSLKTQRVADSLTRSTIARNVYDSLYQEAKQEILDAAAARADSLASKAKAEASAKGDSVSPFRKLPVTSLTVKGASVWIGTAAGLSAHHTPATTRRAPRLLPSPYVPG